MLYRTVLYCTLKWAAIWIEARYGAPLAREGVPLRPFRARTLALEHIVCGSERV